MENPIDLGMRGHTGKEFGRNSGRNDDTAVERFQHGLQTKPCEIAKAGGV
jgi:hypothetical protein